MDPCEERAVAPFRRPRFAHARPEAAPQHDAFRLQGKERIVDVFDVHAERLRQLLGRGWADDGQAPADELRDRAIAIPGTIAGRRRMNDRFEYGVRMDRQQLANPFGRDPDREVSPRRFALRRKPRRVRLKPDTTGASLRCERVEHRRRCGVGIGFREEPRRHEGVVQLVWIARVGPDLVAHALDGRGVEGSEIVGARLTAARLNGMTAPFLERRVVQERVRLRVQDLVRECGRLGRVAGDQPEIPTVNAFQHPRFLIHCSSRQSRTI